MLSPKEKESCKKLVKFIVVVTLGYLAFIQIASLVHLFSIKQKTVSNEFSKEDAPIPALTMCVGTDHLARQEVLDKYNLQSLIFDPDDSSLDFDSITAEFKWRNFDWGSVSLKQLYDEAVIYPHKLITLCEVGDNYDCAQNEGIYHRWENVLKKGYSCSTLRVWKKVPYGEEMRVNMQFEGFRNIPVYHQVHDASKSVPRYINKYLDHQHEIQNTAGHYEQLLQSEFKYTVEKVVNIPENEGQSCSEDPTTDRLKCEEDCFEKQLLRDNSSCVLPWVISSGRQCSSAEEAIAMVKKEKKLQIIQCDCQESCTHFRYIPIEKISYFKDNYGSKALIHNIKGIALIQESYMYTFLDLLANCGGSLGVFFSVSLLWLLKEIVNTVCRLQYLSESLSSNFKDYLLEYFLKALSLVCLSLFFYEGSQLISKYLQYPKSLTVDRLDPFQSRLQNILICRAGPMWLVGNPLPSNYMTLYYPSPLNHMIDCHLDTESCMTDGSLFSWEELNSADRMCSMLRFNDAARYKELHIIFDEDFDKIYILLTPLNRPARYSISTARIDSIGSVLIPNMVESIGFTIEQRINLPPCTDDYLQCQEKCWEESYLKEDLCTPPDMPPTVKHQPCKTASEAIDLELFIHENKEYISSCQCGQRCVDTVIHPTGNQDLYNLYESKLFVSLVPFEYTKTSEEWAYPFNRLIAELGGMLGVLTGMSFLSVLLDSSLKMLAWQSKRCAESSLTKNVWTCVVTLTIFGWFLQQASTSISNYFESPVHLNKEIVKESSLTFLPSFTICWRFPSVYLKSGDVLAYHPDKVEHVLNNTVNDIDWDASWFGRETFLTSCTLFGLSCNEQKGAIHEWHDVPNINNFCKRLDIKPLKLQDYRDNKLVLSVYVYMNVYAAYKEESRLVNLEAIDDYFMAMPGWKLTNRLDQSQYELLEEKPNNCINRLGYNKRNCLDQCIVDHVLEKLKCRFPWMTFNTSLPLCWRYTDYDYLFSIDAIFLAGCQCLPQCKYTKIYVHHGEVIDLQHNLEGIVVVTVEEAKEVFKEKWSYPASQCLADLGGLMSLFTGLTLYDVFLSSHSHILNLLYQVGQALKFLVINRMRI